MKNILSIIFISSLFIILIIIFYFIFKPKITHQKITENFSSSIMENNLISNGSFNNGQHPLEYSGSNGKNDIIVFPNNGQSSYVLRQGYHKKLEIEAELFYKLELNLKPNTIYLLGCLYFSTNYNPLIHKVIFDGDIRRSLKTLDDPKNTQENSDFAYKYTIFRTPQLSSRNSKNNHIHTEILLSFQFNDIKGFNYITDVGLFEIMDSNNIPVTEDLRTYFNSYNQESIKNKRSLIKDLSQNGFDFKASNFSNVEVGNINLFNNRITGPNAFRLQNENMLKLTQNFTFFIFIKGMDMTPSRTIESFTIEGEIIPLPIIIPEDATKIIDFPGNQDSAISIFIPKKYGKIYISAGGMKYETDISHLSFLDTLLAVTYNGNRLILHINDQPIFDTECPKLYFDNKPVVINPNGSFIGTLYAFAYYNRDLTSDQITKISRYFIKMKALGKELSTVSLNMIENVAAFVIAEPKRKPLKKSETKMEEKNETTDEKSPKVIYENGHYFVIVPNCSHLADEIGYSGIRDYGSNIDTAKQIFETNFPKHPLPDILDKRKYKGDLRKCPFIMLTEDNPCRKWDCRNVDWKNGTVKDNNCKKAIDMYCSKNSDTDQACFCWKKENRNNIECLKWRGKFEDPDQCDFRKHRVEDHPESNKWIRKDKIPCWGCNLTAPEATGVFRTRRGSGGR